MGIPVPSTRSLRRTPLILPALLALLAALAMGALLSASLALASGPANDSASAAAYDDGWDDGDDGGIGFGAGWDLISSTTDSSLAGHLIGTSTLNGDGDSNADGDVDTPAARAWGLYADTAEYAHADRPFAEALLLGSSFTLHLDTGAPLAGSTAGFSLRNASNETVLAFYLDADSSTYTLEGLAALDTGLAATDEGLVIQVTLITAGQYLVEVTERAGLTTSTYTGALANPAGGQAITRLHLFNDGSGLGAAARVFFNSLDLLPPACFAQVVGGGSFASADAAAVQAAVEAAPAGAVIHLAGTCAGVLERAGQDQTVYLTQTVTLQGGYNPADWTHDPASYPTTLDALGLGRVVNIVAPDGDIVLEDLTVQGGSTEAGPGGGIYNASLSLTLNGSLITHNHTPYDGGGIYNVYSQLTLDDTTVLSNTAVYNGGGIFSSAGFQVNSPSLPCVPGLRADDAYPSSVTVQNGSQLIDNLAGGEGGGLYGFASLLVVDDSLVQYNAATNGGGIYSADFVGCPAPISFTALEDAEPFAGALLTVSGGSVIDSNSALFEDFLGGAPVENTDAAQGVGGGLFNYQSTAIVLDSTLSNNLALLAGGGAANMQGQLVISATDVYSNGTLLFGGGLASFIYPLVELSGAPVTTPSCPVGPAATDDDSIGALVVVGSQLRDNFAFIYGGGLANDNTLIIVDSSQVTGNFAGNGGGLYNHEPGCNVFPDEDSGFAASMTVQNRSVISGNLATWELIGAPEALTNLETAPTELVLGAGLGGGVFNAGNSLAVYDSLIQENLAQDEGGGLASLGGSVVLSATQVLSNTAVEGSGGGILLDYADYYYTLDSPTCLTDAASSGYADLTVIASAISHNTADDAGGGVASFGPTMRLDATTVAGNTARLGGGLFHEEYTCGRAAAADDGYGAAITVVNGSTLVGNTAAETNPEDPEPFSYAFNGGGIYSQNSSVHVLDSLIAANTAGDDGAGVAAFGSYVVLSSTQVLSNTALDGYGGGVYMDYGGYYRASEGCVAGVAAPASGFWADLVVRGGSEISHNSADNAGGGLSSTGPSILVEASTVSDNRAQLGGGVFHTESSGCGLKPGASTETAAYEAVSIRSGSVISGNRANYSDDPAPAAALARPDSFSDVYQGGGVYAEHSSVGVYDSALYGNSAVDDGGGLYALFAWVSVGDSALYSNTAASGGGAALLDGQAVITNTTVSSNTATGGDGGGLYLAEYQGDFSAPDSAADDAYLGNVTVAANTATGAGQNLFSDSEEYTLRNTLIAGSPAANCAGTLNSAGYNLEDGSTCSLTDATDLPETEALLGPLADHGGDTLTHALLRGSPALDSGFCDFDHDQRGEPRPEAGGAACDIGAVEFRFYTLWLPLIMDTQPDLVGSFALSPNKTSFAAGEAVTVTVVVTNQGTAPTSAGFWVDFSLNPASVPAANRPWYDNCGVSPCHGLAWYVDVSLAPGQSLTLTSTPGSYAPGHTVWAGSLPAGTTDVYLFVDSWNPTSATAAVKESNENNNRAELHGLVVTGPAVPAQAAAASPFADRWVRPVK